MIPHFTLVGFGSFNGLNAAGAIALKGLGVAPATPSFGFAFAGPFAKLSELIWPLEDDRGTITDPYSYDSVRGPPSGALAIEVNVLGA